MPALSKKQQQFMALVLQYKRGELSKDDVSPDVVKAANSMSAKDVEDFASTKHDNLPNSVSEGSWSDGFNKDLRNSKIGARPKNKYIMLDKDGNVLKNIYGDAISAAGILKAAKWRAKEDGISLSDIALIKLDTMDIINDLTFTGFTSRGKSIFNKLNENNGLPDSVDERLESFRKLIRKEVIQNLKDGTYNRDVLKSLIESGRPLNEQPGSIDVVYILLNKGNKKVTIKAQNWDDANDKVLKKYPNSDPMTISVDGEKVGGFGGIEPRANKYRK